MLVTDLLDGLFVAAVELVQVTVDALYVNDHSVVFEPVIGGLQFANRIDQACDHQRTEQFAVDGLEPDLVKQFAQQEFWAPSSRFH